ncbi:hypothetical protein PILCRDRAFT_76259, partial [Piloderma croceum F 1598]
LLQQPVQQEAPPEGVPRGYVRLSVMDGKSLKHKICTLADCQEPLVNYKNGRFCETHLDMRNICGIIPCGRPIRFMGALPPLQDTPGHKVVHTFRAGTIYCVQTVQWACGIPVGWGKCYKSESSPQVLSILDNIWDDHPESKPGFIAYDDACDLLRHIVTQDPTSGWLESTKFIVDAWHYIGHRATDVLCRLWCNPAPTNGSQPDLVLTEVDDDGNSHATRAFNTETAEQLNSWLDGFEAQLSQMTDVNFDIFIHVLFLLFAELTERRIAKKGRELPDDFWEEGD